MTDDRTITVDSFVYERGDDGKWYEVEPADGDSYWVGPLRVPPMVAALDEIERLRADAPNQHGWAVLSSPNVIVVYPYTVARPPGSALVHYHFDQEDPPRWADEGSDHDR